MIDWGLLKSLFLKLTFLIGSDLERQGFRVRQVVNEASLLTLKKTTSRYF